MNTMERKVNSRLIAILTPLENLIRINQTLI